MIPIYQPFLDNCKVSAFKAIESGWISNHGEFVEKATQKLKEVLNVEYAILMSNGTVATHCIFKALKFKHPEINKIYVPNNVYVAAWNSALMEYDKSDLEILPIDKNTWNMIEDEELIVKIEKDSALLVVHNLGNIINVNRIKSLRPDIVIVEDNCEGVFGEYEGIKSGCSSSSLCSSISFYGNKTITTGEGGAFITTDKDIYNFIKRIYSQGMSEERYIHNIMAYNYRMTNVQAAFLYDQLNDIDNILGRKQKLFDNYNSLFQDLIQTEKVELQKVNQNTKRANWMYSVKLVNNNLNPKETFEYFKNKNIETRPFFYPYYKHEHLKDIKTLNDNDFESINLNRQIIMIPSSPMIKYEEQIYIVNCIKEFIESL
jgi:perosamine synthetase